MSETRARNSGIQNTASSVLIVRVPGVGVVETNRKAVRSGGHSSIGISAWTQELNYIFIPPIGLLADFIGTSFPPSIGSL